MSCDNHMTFQWLFVASCDSHMTFQWLFVASCDNHMTFQWLFVASCDSHMTICCTTAPDAPPSNVVVEAVDANSIRLSWDPPPVDQRNGIITRYLIQYLLAHNSSVKDSALSSPATDSLVITGLSPDTAYSFSVAALTSGRQGPPSLGVIQRTYPPLPSPPEVINIPSEADITLTTIPIILPNVNTSQYRYVHCTRTRSECHQNFLFFIPSLSCPAIFG